MRYKVIFLKKDEKDDDKPKKGGALPPYGYQKDIAA